MQSAICFNNIDVQPVYAPWLTPGTTLNVLRLDKLHNVVSGNKWFKLKYYLADAAKSGCTTIGTFGGAYSNHIVAAAFACRQAGFKSVGIIRGEEPAVPSPTLQQAAACGMQLRFVSRTAFKNKEALQNTGENIYWINEGGYGHYGAMGAAEIWQHIPAAGSYTHIVCAVGTGTMLAGLISGAAVNQEIIGISVLKNNFSILNEVAALLHKTVTAGINIQHGYHFGGYAKHPPALIDYMRKVWHDYALPTDIVYTAKAFYATQQLITGGSIPSGSKVLMVHSGGLQGNASLQNGMLPF